MAKQNSIIPIKGTIGNLTFLETKNGQEVRKKRMKATREELDSVNYARATEHKKEWRRGVAASSLMRSAAKDAILLCKDRKMVARLGARMYKVTKEDFTHGRGERTVEDGNLSTLKGFNFNEDMSVNSAWTIDIRAEFDRPSGKMTVHVPEFIPGKAVKIPSGANCFKYHLVASELNFKSDQHVTEDFESDGIFPEFDVEVATDHVFQLSAASTNPVFVMVGIRFYDKVMDKFYPIKNVLNALRITDVFTP